MSKLWGGRFEKGSMDPKVMKVTTSINVDKVLAKYDCYGSMAHISMLEKCGFVTCKEKEDVVKALEEFAGLIDQGQVDVDGYEDIQVQFFSRSRYLCLPGYPLCLKDRSSGNGRRIVRSYQRWFSHLFSAGTHHSRNP